MTKPVKEGLDKIIDEIAELLGTGGNVHVPILKIREASKNKLTESSIIECYLDHKPAPKLMYDCAVRTREKLRKQYSPKDKKEEYSIETGTIPKFAFFELVNELLRREEYQTVASIDEAIGNADAFVLNHYYGDLNCDEEHYYKLVSLAAGNMDAARIEKLKQKNTGTPEDYKLTGQYEVGQIISFPQGLGVILMKRPHNKIIAAMEDKKLMTYLEKGEEHSEIFRRPYAIETMIPDAKGSQGPR